VTVVGRRGPLCHQTARPAIAIVAAAAKPIAVLDNLIFHRACVGPIADRRVVAKYDNIAFIIGRESGDWR